MFYPSDIASEGASTVAAKEFCRNLCPVRAECLAWALGHGEDFGVWGGTTPAERRGTRRARANLADGKCRNGHLWNAENVRHDRRGGEYCVPCRQGWGAKARAKQMQHKESVLGEQFPPVAELVQELPGVKDRPRSSGRPVVAA